jgi:hypothetical protein
VIHGAGGAFTVAYAGSALTTIARAKEQIMLTGGVMTSIAMSSSRFMDFVANRTAANGVFSANENVRVAAQQDVVMHAVFCCGWWDNPQNPGDGYWICNNRWDSRLQTVLKPRRRVELVHVLYSMCL